MATEAQYGVFSKLFDEEQRRYASLATRGNLYLTIITFYLGVLVFKLDDVAKFGSGFHLPIVLFLAIGCVLAVALLLTVLALGIHEFEGVCDPEGIIKSFGKSPPTDAEFLDNRIVDLAVATKRNHRQNENVAAKLQWAARVIFLAALLQIVVFIVAIVHARTFSYAQAPETRIPKCECQSNRRLRQQDASSAQEPTAQSAPGGKEKKEEIAPEK